MQKSVFPKMRHYVGFWQIGSHIHSITPVLTQQIREWHQIDWTSTKNVCHIVTQSICVIQSTHEKVLNEEASTIYICDHCGHTDKTNTLHIK